MNLPDDELVRLLEARDGPLGSRWRPHMVDGSCGYGDPYPEGECPWCRAELRRIAEGRLPAAQRSA